MFEAADTMKRSIIVEWNTLADEDRLLLRQYLLQFCLTRDSCPSFVRSKILQVAAIMIKRASIRDSGMERCKCIDEMCQMVKFGDARQKYLACRIILAIMQEFVTTVKSDDHGLMFDEHFKAMKLFELSDLLKIFLVIFEACAELLLATSDSARLAENMPLLLEYISISEMVLLWGYVSPLLPKRLINALEVNKIDAIVSLRCSARWEAAMTDPKLLDTFFNLYWKVRDIDELQPKSLTCLVQLATLNGPAIDGPGNRLKYVSNYMQHFLQLIGSRPVGGNEAYGFAIIFRKILLHTSDRVLRDLPEDIRPRMLQEMFVITCNYMELVATDDDDVLEDSSYAAALNNILHAWLLVMQARSCFSAETLAQYAVQLFEKYLQCRLSPAAIAGGGIVDDVNATLSGGRRGQRDNKGGGGGATADDIEQLSEFERHDEQLIIIGMFGREQLGQTMPTLCRLLEERTRLLREQLLRVYQSNAVDPKDSAIFETIYDDLLWIIMVGAHVLALQASGEDALVPEEIQKFSSAQAAAGMTDVATTLKLLASPGNCVREIASAEQSADYVVRFVAAVFRLCDIENKAIELNMTPLLSPEVTRTIMQFISMWSETYLLHSNNENVSGTF